MSCLYFKFHTGHRTTAVTHNGKASMLCFDCGILADIEAIGGEVSAEDALKDGAEVQLIMKSMTAGTLPPESIYRVILNQLSPGVKLC
jgi:hypothetical protein